MSDQKTLDELAASNPDLAVLVWQRQRDTRRISFMFLLLTAGTFFCLWLVVSGNRDRVHDIERNRDERLAQIQKARIQSCKLTYEGVRRVFQPFIPNHATGPERERVRKFNDRIDELKRDCKNQIGGEGR